MVKTLGTNSNHDIYIQPNGNLAFLSGQEAVEGACATASKLQLGEAVLQTTLGIPNFQAVWIGTPNIKVFESYLRNTLLSVEGVVSVVSLRAAYADNVLSYTAEIESQYGTLFLNG